MKNKILVAIDDDMYLVSKKDYNKMLKYYNEKNCGDSTNWDNFEQFIKLNYEYAGRVQTFFS